jgi:transposase
LVLLLSNLDFTRGMASVDMRRRVIAEVESGASASGGQGVAVSASTAIIWVKCFRETGRCAAKPQAGVSHRRRSTRISVGSDEKQPDLTLDEPVLAKRPHKIPDSRTAVWRFFRGHKITFKKACAQEQERADVVRARRRGMREQGIFGLAHLVIIDETADNTRCCGFTAIAGAASGLIDRAPQGRWKTILLSPHFVETTCARRHC